MSRRWLLSLLCLSILLLLSVQLSRARGVLKVNETATRFRLRDGKPRVSLVVENGFDKPFQAVVELELVDPEGIVKAAAAPNLTIAGGRQTLDVDLLLKNAKLTSREKDELLWYRLRYRLVPEPTSGAGPVSSVISLSEITPDLFEIRVASSHFVREGMRYRATVRAQHPLTNRPARGVNIDAKVEFENDNADNDTTVKAKGVTDGDGVAILDFDLPRKIKDDDIELTINARRDSFNVEESRSIDLTRRPYILVSSDKEIYQPGQVLHARVLMFDSAKRAIANSPATLKITDPDDEISFQTKLTTSKFGIASADWPIPANTRLGSYRVEFRSEDDEYSSSAVVKISRYDLPNFSVNLKPDRSYYLPQQNAEVEVAATYLFGQPVKRGHVRVVRETERTWNYREQKYDAEEEEQYEGETDARGVFKVHIDLAKSHAELVDSDYRRFEDLSYAAYFTDPTTNRTEQRRFDLRITKEAIHIYVVKSEDRYYENSRLPLQFFVSTSYADGTAAPCRIVISRTSEDKAGTERELRSIKTNRYGVARVRGIDLQTSGSSDSQLALNFLATDNQGRIGKHSEGYYVREAPVLRVTTDKTIYRQGEPVEITLNSSEKNRTAQLEVSRDGVVLHSELVSLHGGRATLTLPWSRELTDRLLIAVYFETDDEYNNIVMGRHTIVFPRNRELKLGLQANHKEYRPGEDAQFNFRVRDPEGRSAAGALGVVVFDKAVEERARTDQEFGDHSYRSENELLRFLGDGDAVAGFSLKELSKLDLSKPIDPDLELLTEMILNQGQWYYPYFFGGSGYEKNQATVFGNGIKAQLKPLHDALQVRYELARQYPADEASLKRILLQTGTNYEALRDPWTTPYRASFSIDRTLYSLSLTSAGPDKRFDTPDDFRADELAWPYFRGLGEAIDRVVHTYHQRTGSFIRDHDVLRNELIKCSVDLDELRDPWLHPYKVDFAVSNNFFEISVSSAGPNGLFETYPLSDDFSLWSSPIDYFAESRSAIDAALASSVRITHHAPKNDAELNAALQGAGVSLEQLHDPWGERYYSTFHEGAIYGGSATIEMRGDYGKPATEKLNVRPVTKRVLDIKLRSSGPDRLEGTADDFDAGVFTATLSEQGATDLAPRISNEMVTFNGATGAIRGVITDPNGGVVSGSRIVATHSYTAETFTTLSGDEGRYLLKNLTVGLYTVRIDTPSFQSYIIDHVLVRSSNVVEVNAVLSVGNISEAVTVSAEESSLDHTESASVSSTVTQRAVVPFGKQQVSTPRLREYFPETLVWQPSLETDKQGRAQINFKLADNITTWKMAVIGSTEDGQIGTVEKEFKAFQPFFVEHDPPRILTEGDEISLPVVVRNYLERAQPVDLELKPESWFTLLAGGQKQAQVAAGDATRETFDFRAIAAVKDGKQRITATGADDSDAIEKPVTVHPDGEEKSVTAGDLVTDNATLTLEIPVTLIPNSAEAELKIYPNLMAHVSESVEAIMQRPYGCGEQTISSTYPSLLVVQKSKLTGQHSALQERAERYLRDGYSRLLNYRADSGGFTYWGRGEADLALTAYALRFLNDARDLIAVDDEVISQTRKWLVKQQRDDGSWGAYDYGSKLENKRRTALLTAYVARVLARSAQKAGTKPQSPNTSPELKRALDYLGARVAEINEPYLLASYAIAALDAGDDPRAATAIAKLSTLTHKEGDSIYWSLETNTPFYGWGLAGRIETTALVVQALAKGCVVHNLEANTSIPQSQLCNQQLINPGLLFLLRQKDRYGVWYSSQATINVLDALLAVLAKEMKAGTSIDARPTADIIVNGKTTRTVELPASNLSVNPITVDLSSLVQPGTNRIQIRRAGGASPASVQAVATYYIPWSASIAGVESSARAAGSSGLRLLTKFDRTEGQVSDVISCHVEAERIGFGGYGMLLAEIGLPPGADVDRASLENAMKNSDWAISQYDILPDRVVVYLWPRAGGIQFDFKFRPRFGLKAKTASSSIYDYYNPEARAVVAPTKFVVK